jgi:tetratricopeptide (TPR) repeat protein
MKSSFFILLFFIAANLVWAQDLEDVDLSGDVKMEEVSELPIYLQNAQYLKAIEYIDQQKSTKDLLYQKAVCYKFLNDYSKAVEILESLSETYPDDIPIRLQLALCYEATSLFGKSVDCYAQLAELDSTNYKKILDHLNATKNLYFLTLKGQGIAYEGEDQYVEALDAYTAAIQKTPFVDDKMDIYFRMANMCEYAMEDINTALLYYELYRQSLVKYFEAMKDDPMAEMLNQSISSLNNHIRQLKAEYDMKEEHSVVIMSTESIQK